MKYTSAGTDTDKAEALGHNPMAQLSVSPVDRILREGIDPRVVGDCPMPVAPCKESNFNDGTTQTEER